MQPSSRPPASSSIEAEPDEFAADLGRIRTEADEAAARGRLPRSDDAEFADDLR